MIDQKTLRDLYKKHHIGANYGVTLPEFVKDFRRLKISPYEQRNPNLENIVQRLIEDYKANTIPTNLDFLKIYHFLVTKRERFLN